MTGRTRAQAPRPALRPGFRRWAIAATVLCASGAARLAAQDFERRLLAIPDTATTRRMTHDLTGVPHVAGTPAQAATRDYVVAQMRSWGLDTWTKEYTVYLPYPDNGGGVGDGGPRRARRAAGARRALWCGGMPSHAAPGCRRSTPTPQTVMSRRRWYTSTTD